MDFYKDWLKERGDEAIIPSENDITIVSEIIFDKFCHGKIELNSKGEYLRLLMSFKSVEQMVDWTLKN